MKLLVLLMTLVLGSHAFAVAIGNDTRFYPKINLDPNKGDPTLRTVGRLQGIHGEVCTATLIHKKLILTAAHCLRKNTYEIEAEDIRFFPSGEASSVGEAGAQIYFMSDDQTRRDQDVAVIELINEVGMKYGWTPLNQETVKTGLALPQYRASDRRSVGLFSLLVNKESCSSYHYKEGALLHDCPMNPGASGGPLLARVDGKNYSIVAINTEEVNTGLDCPNFGFEYQCYNTATSARDFYPFVKSILNQQK